MLYVVQYSTQNKISMSMTEVNVVILLTFVDHKYFASHSAKYWAGHRYFIHKTGIDCLYTSEEKSVPNCHLVITSGRPINRVHQSLVIFNELIN